VAGSRWTCPYCGHVQTLTEPKMTSGITRLNVASDNYSQLALWAIAVGCSNPDCDQVQVTAKLGVYGHDPITSRANFHSAFAEYRLRPDSVAKPQPDFIPHAIRIDYEEACKISHLSPKASATLARRCIQGMIRDFCGVTKKRLIDEINTLKSLEEDDKLPRGVTVESIEAIDAVRKIGNIGAHMEKDIDLIIEVDPEEAATLIELIETLLEDWYVARERRKSRFAKVNAIAETKSQEKSMPNGPKKKEPNELVKTDPTSGSSD